MPGSQLGASYVADTEAAGLDVRLTTVPYARHMYSPGVKPPGDQEVDALSRRVSQWRDYNRTWLGMNLGGEAAEEYVSTSTHWGFGGADDPRVNLRFLRENVEIEISKLESIRDRLPMWLPLGATAPTSAATGSRADGGSHHDRYEPQACHGHLRS